MIEKAWEDAVRGLGNDSDLKTKGSLSNDVIERRTSPGSGIFELFGRNFEQIIGEIVFFKSEDT